MSVSQHKTLNFAGKKQLLPAAASDRDIRRRIVYFFCGILLYPFAVALCRVLVWMFRSCPGPETVEMPADLFIFASGFIVFCILYLFLGRPTRFYVAGHELTHVIFGLMVGSRISKFRVGEEEGRVTLSRPWMLPSLAPYFFPLYSVCVLCIYGLFSASVKTVPTWTAGLFSFITGFFWGFHICCTANALLQHQRDMERFGTFFSYMFIVTMNLAALILILLPLTPLAFVDTLLIFVEMSASVFGSALNMIL